MQRKSTKQATTQMRVAGRRHFGNQAPTTRHHRRPRLRLLVLALASTLAALTLIPSSQAATRTWDGGGGTDNWSNENNWNGNTDIALNGTDSIVFAASGANRLYTNVQNLVGLSVFGLTFNANAPTMNIQGDLPITILGGGITINAYSVVVTYAPLIVGASQTWSSGTYVNASGVLAAGGISFADGSGAYVLSIVDTTIQVRGNITNNTTSRQTITSSGNGPGLQMEYGNLDGGSAGLSINSAIWFPQSGNVTTVTLNRNVFVQSGQRSLEIGTGLSDSFIIKGGSTFASKGGYLGSDLYYPSGGYGVVTVTGAGSAWSNSSDLVVGDQGRGLLEIADGGRVNSRSSFIGSHGRGDVTITGAESLWSNADSLVVGHADIGFLDITNGGKVTNYDGFIGFSTGSDGRVVVGGAGASGQEATWENAGVLYVGQQGRGTLVINSGGKVVAGGMSIGAQGSLSVAGGTLQLLSPTISLNATGQFNWNAGTVRFMNPFTLGSGMLGNTQLLVAGQTLEAATSFAIGAGSQLQLAGGTLGGTGTLLNSGYLSGFGTIAGSGGFSNNGLLAQSGGNMVLSNTGPNANNGNWDLLSGFQLQLDAGATLVNRGFLNLNSGQVSGAGTLANAAGGVIGGRGVISTVFSNAGALAIDSGTTSITRAFTNSGQIQLSSSTALLSGGIVTNSGRIEGIGRVSNAITNNGTVEAIGGTLTLAGSLTNTSAGVIAAGNGARVLVNAGLASNAGQIQLAGGTFDNNGASLANAATGVISGYGTLHADSLANDGKMLLSGGTSAVRANLVANGNSQIVLSGNSNTTFYGAVEVKSGAELRVSQGSVATFFGQVNQRNGALFTGTGAKNYESGLAVGNSPGLGTDAGSVSFGSANVYEAEIGGTNPGDALGTGIQFDRYVVGGTLTFGGTLKVVQYGGFAPQAGQSFDLFDWSTRQGQFSTIDFTAAPLANGLTWDTSHLYTDGTITVAAVPEPGTYAMFAAGLGLMGFMVRRRRSAAPA